MDLAKHCIVKSGGKLRLKDRDTDDTFGKKRDDACEAALWHCSTDRTLVPGPANKKWFRNHVVMELIVRALERMKLKYPAPTVDISKVVPN